MFSLFHVPQRLVNVLTYTTGPSAECVRVGTSWSSGVVRDFSCTLAGLHFRLFISQLTPSISRHPPPPIPSVFSAMQDEEEYVFKLLLIGDSLVGKSCLITRYADDSFEQNFIATIGVDFKVKSVEVDGGKTARLQIWDTAGQERFSNITRSYYRGSDAILIVYDITNRESFSHVTKWVSELQQNAEDTRVRLLIGNKADLEEKRVVSHDEGAAFAAEVSMQFFETSALTGDNVSNAFQDATLQCQKEFDTRGGPRAPKPSVKLDPRNVTKGGKGGGEKRGCAC